MKRALVLILFLVVLGALAWSLTRYGSRPRPWELSGTIESNTIKVGSTVGGRVVEVLVQEGQKVQAKQPLVRFDPDLLDLQIREQEAQVAQAKALFEKAQRGPRSEELSRAQIDWKAAETDRLRFESLYAQGIIGRRDLDAAQVREATAQQTLKELETGTRAEDIDQARSAVAQAEQRLAYLVRQRRELEVVAPVDGVIETFDLRAGDLVAPNQPVAELLAAGDLWVRVFVPEPQLGRISVGREVFVTVDGFPGRRFPGKVVDIRDRAEYTPRNIQTVEQRQDQVFGVKVQIDPTPELKAGMAAFVRLDS